MILLLGKNDAISEYLKDVLKLDVIGVDIIKDNNVLYCPSETTHYSELFIYVDIIKETNPNVVITQRTDMIDELLESDLEFEVVRVCKNDHGLWATPITKAEAKEMRDEYRMELR